MPAGGFALRRHQPDQPGGARPTGIARARPAMVAEVSTLEISRSTPGTNSSPVHAARFRPRASSSRDPPSRPPYRKAGGGIRAPGDGPQVPDAMCTGQSGPLGAPVHRLEVHESARFRAGVSGNVPRALRRSSQGNGGSIRLSRTAGQFRAARPSRSQSPGNGIACLATRLRTDGR